MTNIQWRICGISPMRKLKHTLTRTRISARTHKRARTHTTAHTNNRKRVHRRTLTRIHNQTHTRTHTHAYTQTARARKLTQLLAKAQARTRTLTHTQTARTHTLTQLSAARAHHVHLVRCEPSGELAWRGVRACAQDRDVCAGQIPDIFTEMYGISTHGRTRTPKHHHA